MGVRVAEFKLLVNNQAYQCDDTWPRQSLFQSTVQRSLYGGKLFNLLIDPKEEHALLPLKQPHIPVLKAAAEQHLATFKTYVRLAGAREVVPLVEETWPCKTTQ